MDERRLTKKPWFFPFIWSLIWGIVYLWQIRRMGGFALSLVYIIIDVILFGIGLLIWLAFFTQFVLPVRTFRDRQKIFDRLLAHMSGGHGPAIFIRDGKKIKHFGEEKKKGPGVLWLDSASAAVTRTAAKYEKTIGPGVHFIKKGESIAGTVDLHAQAHGLGPREAEDPFAKQKDGQSDDEFNQTQKRRMEVSAWTRDGIEIVPNISVVFKIDAAPAKGDDDGSRFGYDPESVRRAITGEGVTLETSKTPRRIAWNQLPARLAADLWREYLSKFTLAELFEASQPGPKPKPPAPAPEPDETKALLEPVIPGRNWEKALAGMLHEMNIILARWVDRCERTQAKDVRSVTPTPKPTEPEIKEPEPETALQTINRMIKARMTEAETEIVDDHGKPGEGTLASPEYELLKQRGLKVIAAGVGNLRFPPDIEEQLIHQWSTTWINSAKAERDRIDRQRGFVELSGQVEAELRYALSLSRNLLKHRPSEPKDTLKTLMQRSRDEIIKNDRLHRRASMEREELDELIQWVERNSV